MTLRIGIAISSLDDDVVELVRGAERLGVDSVWVPEFWAADALTPLAYLAACTSTMRLGTAIVQLGARTPAMLGMSAMSLQAMSGGRFILGVGTSGPQVMEGWHGVHFDGPVQRTRETIEIVRRICRGERLEYRGRYYEMPVPGGHGRALRTSAPTGEVPIYVAALGPRNLEMTGELADGWLGTSFMPESAEAFLVHLRAGAERAGRKLSDLDLVVPVTLEFGEDVEEIAKRHARGYAFTFGAMGSPSQNFYLDAFTRQGFGDAARTVQRLWLEGRRDQAAGAVPVEIALRTNLLGTDGMVAERLAAYRAAGITTLQVAVPGDSLAPRLASLERLLHVAGSV